MWISHAETGAFHRPGGDAGEPNTLKQTSGTLGMGLNERDVRTIEIAGNLMNLGKMLVPPDVLTKAEALTADELEQVRGSILTSGDLLEGVNFDGPVVETIRQGAGALGWLWAARETERRRAFAERPYPRCSQRVRGDGQRSRLPRRHVVRRSDQ